MSATDQSSHLPFLRNEFSFFHDQKLETKTENFETFWLWNVRLKINQTKKDSRTHFDSVGVILQNNISNSNSQVRKLVDLVCEKITVKTDL